MQTECNGSGVKKESPIDVALGKVESEIATLQETVVRFETILASVLTNPETSSECDAPNSKGQTSLESRLFAMAERIMDVNTSLRQIQNRTQL